MRANWSATGVGFPGVHIAGDAVVFYRLASDPKASINKLMESTAPFDLWLRTQAQKSHPIALEMLKKTVMENVLVADYPRK